MSSDIVEAPICGGRGNVVWFTARRGISLVDPMAPTCWIDAVLPPGIWRRRSIGGRFPGSAQTGGYACRPSVFNRDGTDRVGEAARTGCEPAPTSSVAT